MKPLRLWAVQYNSRDEYVTGYGPTARHAVLDALQRIEEGRVFARLSGFVSIADVKQPDLIKVLGIGPPKFEEEERRD